MKKLADSFQHFMNKKWITTFGRFLRSFINHDLFILFYLVICLINWKFQLTYLAIVIGVIFLYLIIILDINRFRLVPILLFILASIRLPQPSDYLWPAIIGAVFVLPITLFDLVKKPLRLNNQILIGMIFLLIAMFFSIINTPRLWMSILGVSTMLVYIYIFIYFFNKKQDYSQSELWLYLAKSFTYFGILILLETIFFNFEVVTDNSFISFFNWSVVDLGWANTNYIAMIYLVIIPLTGFWYSKTQKHFYLIIMLLIEIFAFILLISRGAYVAMLVSGLPFFIVFFTDIKNKVAFTQKSLFLISFVLIALLIIAIPTGLVKNFFAILNSRGLSLAGRELLYRIGFNVFLRYPLFGGGIYTSEYYLSLVSTSVYYHNFIIQTLATIGVFGMIAFSYYLYQVFRQSLWKCSYNNYIFIIILGITVHGLFDTTFYNPIIMIILSIILPLMLEKNVIDEQNREELTRVYN
ncbi:MAG TPA: O-antigen ligase family protein [Bacilli bacterium]|nr:MAG: O-Antigen ligase [Tenericutes bacterium ADurb.BinA124]HPX84855.1 O-antigen ligase family protein [Bacilli bacterium]